MKKFILMLALICAVVSANAQIATENSNALDNIYVGMGVGVATPLNFNSVFPLNTVGEIKIGKKVTPVLGFEVEGQVFFNENNFERWTSTAVKGTNVFLNGTVNLTNLFCDYLGTPRRFEVETNTGLGWLYGWNIYKNDLSAKTALDLKFNLGKSKATALVVSPGVYWNLTASQPKVQFNKNFAQLAIMASFVYHFKTSNGTHHFKTYDIGAMNDEINRLQTELSKKPTEVIKTNVVEREVIKTVDGCEHVVYFAQNSDILTSKSKADLNNVKGSVKVEGYASPEGTEKYNKELSQRRANVVAEYLRSRGVTVTEAVGCGVAGETSNRVVIVTND